MAKAERGTKRQCTKCASKFYDLNADPIICPVCQTPFVLETETSEAVDAEPVKSSEDSTEVETESSATEAGAEVISFEDADEENNDSADENLPDVDLDDDVDDIGGEVDNSFIEGDDEDDNDELGIPVERPALDE